jgi:N6-L-threonylcarbamoyladenine synthase
MIILGIETSCDETSAALIKTQSNSQKVEVLSNIIASSVLLHAKTGGIIPDIAAREQVKYIIPVIDEALKPLKNPSKEIDAIAVTVGPGLIGSLLVGVETAKTFSYIWQKPIIPINHLFGHIYANFIKQENNKNEIQFPAIALVVSGGHTDIVLIKNHGDISWLGGTRDDAAGEAFDKTGRLLNLTYPAGPQIEKLASNVNKDLYNFPRPIIGSNDFDFSFSGLKTAILRETQKPNYNQKRDIENICYSLQIAISDVLIKKTLKAVNKYNAKSILLGGGVAANQTLSNNFKLEIETLRLETQLFVPESKLCTDNAAMIAAASYFNYEEKNWKDLTANPELYFD